MMDGLGPVSRWRFTQPGGPWYLTSEIAKALEIDIRTLIGRCTNKPHLSPANIGRYAKRDVWLFTLDEVEALRVDLEQDPPQAGRPTIWSRDETIARQRLRIRRDYWQKKADLADYQGSTARRDHARDQVDNINRLLELHRPGVPLGS